MKRPIMFIGMVTILAIAVSAFGTTKQAGSPILGTIKVGDQFQAPEPGGGAAPLGRGGPDGFGYCYMDSDEPGGPPPPSVMWVELRNRPGAIMLPSSDDWVSGWLYPAGFTFWYYGVVYNRFSVGSNGYLSFVHNLVALSGAIPSTTDPDGVVAPLWTDLNPSRWASPPYGELWWWNNSANGNIVIEYYDVPHFFRTYWYTFEVILNWGADAIWATQDDVIYFLYQNKDPAGEWWYYGATVGIENATGTIGLPYPATSVHNNQTIKWYYVPPPALNARADKVIVPHDADLLPAGTPFRFTGQVTNVGTSTVNFPVEAAVYECEWTYPAYFSGPSLVSQTKVWADTVMSGSLIYNQSRVLTWTRMFTPAADQDYKVVITTLLPGDQVPGNDSCEKLFKAPSLGDLVKLKFHTWTGTPYGGYYFYAFDWISATELEPIGYPCQVKYIRSHNLLRDYPYQWPDGVSDVCHLSVWKSLAFRPYAANEVSGADVCGIDPAPSGWYYHVPVDSLAVSREYFYVGFNNLPPGGQEGIMIYPGSPVYPERKWHRHAGGAWEDATVTNFFAGDHVQEAFVLVPPPLAFCGLPVTYAYDPPDPWVEEECITIPICIEANAKVDDVSVSAQGVLKHEDPGIHQWLKFDFFEPPLIPAMDMGDQETVLGGMCFPIGIPAGNYLGTLAITGTVRATGEVKTVLGDVIVTVGSSCDLDINDDHANLTANTMLLAGPKPSQDDEIWFGAYAIHNPGMHDNGNPDFWDGPGNVGLDAIGYEVSFPFDVEPNLVPVNDLKRGHAALNLLQVTVPAQGIGAHKMFGGTVTVTGSSGDCGASDNFTLLVQVDPPGHWGARDESKCAGGHFGARAEAFANALCWSSAGLSEVGYNIYRSGSASSFAKLNKSPLTGKSYSDGDVVAGGTYQYKLGLIFEDGREVLLGPLSVTTKIVPRAYALSENFPNPVSNETVIRYAIPSEGRVSLSIYDIAGRVVETLVDEHQTPGLYSVSWKPEDAANGVYFYRLTAGDFSQTRKLVVMK